MSGEHFCFTSPDDPEPLECEQCAVFAERADYWRDAAEKRDAWLDAEMDRRRAAEAEVERLRLQLAAAQSQINGFYLGSPDTRLRDMTHERDALRVEVERLRADAERYEPVAWAYVNSDGECEEIEYGRFDENDDSCITHLYAHPSRREPRPPSHE